MICADVVPRTIESSTSNTFLAAELQIDGVQLAAYRLRTLLLARHDEGCGRM